MREGGPPESLDPKDYGKLLDTSDGESIRASVLGWLR